MLGSMCLLALGSIASLVSAAPATEDCPPAGANVTAHTGTPVGKPEVYEGSKYSTLGNTGRKPSNF